MLSLETEMVLVRAEFFGSFHPYDELRRLLAVLLFVRAAILDLPHREPWHAPAELVKSGCDWPIHQGSLL